MIDTPYLSHMYANPNPNFYGMATFQTAKMKQFKFGFLSKNQLALLCSFKKIVFVRIQ